MVRRSVARVAEGGDKLVDESGRTRQRQRDRMPLAALHFHLQVVVPVHAFIGRAMGARKVTPGPVEHLLHFGHHRGVVLGGGGGQGFQRGDAVVGVAEVEGEVVHVVNHAVQLRRY